MKHLVKAQTDKTHLQKFSLNVLNIDISKIRLILEPLQLLGATSWTVSFIIGPSERVVAVHISHRPNSPAQRNLIYRGTPSLFVWLLHSSAAHTSVRPATQGNLQQLYLDTSAAAQSVFHCPRCPLVDLRILAECQAVNLALYFQQVISQGIILIPGIIVLILHLQEPCSFSVLLLCRYRRPLSKQSIFICSKRQCHSILDYSNMHYLLIYWPE